MRKNVRTADNLKTPWTYEYRVNYGLSWKKYTNVSENYNATVSLKDHVRGSVDNLAKFLLHDFIEKLQDGKVRIEGKVGYWHITRSWMAKELTKSFTKVRNTYNLLPKIINFGMIKGHSRSIGQFKAGLINCLELSFNMDFVEYEAVAVPKRTTFPDPPPPVVLTAEAEKAENTNYVSKIQAITKENDRIRGTSSIGNLINSFFKRE